MNVPPVMPTLPTGVPGLDEVLGGGLPELSFNLLAGGPGAGKTTLAHQIIFRNATRERPALYFTILGEPPLKMLRYQQCFTFYDLASVNETVHFVHLHHQMLEHGLEAVLQAIKDEVAKADPGLVVVDSFRAVTRASRSRGSGEMGLEEFVQNLGLLLTTSQATTFLLGEYQRQDEESPIFTVADAIIWLSQAVERNSTLRKLQVVKVRGQEPIPGLHACRITRSGLQVFPRLPKPPESAPLVTEPRALLHTGVPALDAMMSGGIPSGHSVLVAGPSGSGKTVLSMQFIAEGIRRGEPGIVALFEKRPGDYLKTVPLGQELVRMAQGPHLELFYMRPLDLSIDEALYDLRSAVLRMGARRLVIDSLLGFELALAPTNREDFRESLYRMIGALTALDVTVMMTIELVDSYVDLRFSPHGITFLTDIIIMQRYVEVDARLQQVMTVVKHRTSAHSKELRSYEITDEGIVVGPRLSGYTGLLSGRPVPESPPE